MILILSSNNDQSTDNVIDWIKSDFTRIGREDFCSNLNLVLNSESLNLRKNLVDGELIFLNEITAFWYRREDFSFNINSEKVDVKDIIVRQNLESEWIKLKDFLHICYESINSIGSFRKEVYHNKLTALFIARQLGINIPPTIITTKKEYLLDFIQVNDSSITKTINSMFKIEQKNFFQTIGTQVVKESLVEKLDDTFFPTLIQQNIDKVFEVRIFYIRMKFYTMAIFSQNDDKTKIDYRNYNKEKPNRNIPYVLPNEIQEKLQKLMDKLELDSGSIDLIVTLDGRYVFLEVNPTGQFGWVSENCNYYLEEKIANYLQNIS